MTTRHAPHEAIDVVEADHVELRRMLHTLDQELRRRRPDSAEVGKRLYVLVRQLEAHFAHEEDGGYFAGILEAAPQVRAQVDLLQQQHQTMRQQVQRMVQMARMQPLSPSTWEQLGSLFGGFTHDFSVHEQAEHKLLEETVLRDMDALD